MRIRLGNEIHGILWIRSTYWPIVSSTFFGFASKMQPSNITTKGLKPPAKSLESIREALAQICAKEKVEKEWAAWLSLPDIVSSLGIEFPKVVQPRGLTFFQYITYKQSTGFFIILPKNFKVLIKKDRGKIQKCHVSLRHWSRDALFFSFLPRIFLKLQNGWVLYIKSDPLSVQPINLGEVV